MQYSFHHLIDYDCRYYTYVCSQMLVKDLVGRFVGGIRDGKTGARLEYRRAILEPGSTKDAVELVRGYLGREWGPEAFYRWLNEEEE